MTDMVRVTRTAAEVLVTDTTAKRVRVTRTVAEVLRTTAEGPPPGGDGGGGSRGRQWVINT